MQFGMTVTEVSEESEASIYGAGNADVRVSSLFWKHQVLEIYLLVCGCVCEASFILFLTSCCASYNCKQYVTL
jgi:hypothetical protein